MKEFFFKTLPAFMRGKPFTYGFFFLVVAGIITFFIFAWKGYTPQKGPDQTDPWSHPKPGRSS